MTDKDKNLLYTIVGLALASLAIVSLFNFFKNDRNEIVSDEGKHVLDDEEKMKSLHKKLADQETDERKANTQIVI